MKTITITELRWIMQSLGRDVENTKTALAESGDTPLVTAIAKLDIANKAALQSKIDKIIAREVKRSSRQR